MQQNFTDLILKTDRQKLHLIDPEISLTSYCHLDLSVTNDSLQKIDLSSSANLERYVNSIIEKNNAKAAFGGYLEKRNIYQRSDYFNKKTDPKDERNIHLGLDIWAPAETSVLAGFDGSIHSFANNTNFGDYGPTIILEHYENGQAFYSLYGHLGLDSIASIKVGQEVKQGQEIATLGAADVNGDYPPHLHFQLILDIQNFKGDYPGVCSENELAFYKKNCPDPTSLITQ